MPSQQGYVAVVPSEGVEKFAFLAPLLAAAAPAATAAAPVAAGTAAAAAPVAAGAGAAGAGAAGAGAAGAGAPAAAAPAAASAAGMTGVRAAGTAARMPRSVPMPSQREDKEEVGKGMFGNVVQGVKNFFGGGGAAAGGVPKPTVSAPAGQTTLGGARAGEVLQNLDQDIWKPDPSLGQQAAESQFGQGVIQGVKEIPKAAGKHAPGIAAGALARGGGQGQQAPTVSETTQQAQQQHTQQQQELQQQQLAQEQAGTTAGTGPGVAHGTTMKGHRIAFNTTWSLLKAHRQSEEDPYDEDEIDPKELGDYEETEEGPAHGMGEDEDEWAEYGGGVTPMEKPRIMETPGGGSLQRFGVQEIHDLLQELAQGSFEHGREEEHPPLTERPPLEDWAEEAGRKEGEGPEPVAMPERQPARDVPVLRPPRKEAEAEEEEDVRRE